MSTQANSVRDTLELALDALLQWVAHCPEAVTDNDPIAIAALKRSLAEEPTLKAGRGDPEEGEPEIRWVYRQDGKAHIAGTPTIEDTLKYLSAPAIPEGWQLVPIEPTEEMLDADQLPSKAIDTYKAMLSAAKGETK